MMNIKETLVVALGCLIFLVATGAAKADEVEKQKVDGYVKHYYKTVQVQNRQSV